MPLKLPTAHVRRYVHRCATQWGLDAALISVAVRRCSNAFAHVDWDHGHSDCVTITFDRASCTKLTPARFRFVVAHELVHVLFAGYAEVATAIADECLKDSDAIRAALTAAEERAINRVAFLLTETLPEYRER